MSRKFAFYLFLSIVLAGALIGRMLTGKDMIYQPAIIGFLCALWLPSACICAFTEPPRQFFVTLGIVVVPVTYFFFGPFIGSMCLMVPVAGLGVSAVSELLSNPDAFKRKPRVLGCGMPHD